MNYRFCSFFLDKIYKSINSAMLLLDFLEHFKNELPQEKDQIKNDFRFFSRNNFQKMKMQGSSVIL